MKYLVSFVCCLAFLCACGGAEPTVVPVTTAPATALPTAEPVFADTPLPPAYSGPFELRAVPPDKLLGDCNFTPPSDLPSQGLTELARVQFIGCQYGETALFEIGERLYAAQSGLATTLFNLTDVTDPTAPQPIGAWLGSGFAYSADLKAFRQGDRHFLALSFDDEAPNVCGIAIIEVTDPRAPKLLRRVDGSTVGAETPWCNVHTIEIDRDAQGNGNYLLASDTDTYSLRVLDIRNLDQIRQVNTFHLHAHPHVNPTRTGDWLNYVHDSAIGDDRVYVAYWHAGAVILDKTKLYAGLPQQGFVVQPTENLAPVGFLTHYVHPTPDGNYLFLEDEINVENGIRMFDIRDPANPREVAAIRLDDPFFTAHNFIVQDNLLLVGWYQDGARVFRYDMTDSAHPEIEQVAYYAVRKHKTSGPYGPFTGLWGLRVHPCSVRGAARTCVYASDTEGGLLILALDPGIEN